MSQLGFQPGINRLVDARTTAPETFELSKIVEKLQFKKYI